METFHFQLERVLEWRRTQLELEQSRLRSVTAGLAELDRQRAELEAAGVKAELSVRGAAVSGADLAALGEFRGALRKRKNEIASRRAAQVQKVAAQEGALREARRRCRLLERLKERRTAEWRAAEDRELESLGSESFLAGWNRRRIMNP